MNDDLSISTDFLMREVFPKRLYLLADSLYDTMLAKNVGTLTYHVGGEVYVMNHDNHVGFVKGEMCSPGTMDDVSGKSREFLDYVAGQKPEDSFVEKLEEAVQEAKINREWRHEHMLLLMRDQEKIEKVI